MPKNRPKPPKKAASAPIKEAPKRPAPKTSSASGLSSMINWLVILALILPLIFSKSVPDAMLIPRYIFQGFFVLLFLAYFFLYKNRPVPELRPQLLKWIFILGLLYAGWCVFSMFTATNMTPAYYEIGRWLLNLLLLFIVMVAIQQEGSAVIKICIAVMVIAMLGSLIGILQFSGDGFRNIPGNIVPFGLNANRNLFGSAQTFTIPFTIYILYKGNKGWKNISVVALILTIISIVISQTRSSWLGGAGILLGSLFLVYLFSKPNRKKWLVGSAAAVAGIAAIVALLLVTDTDGILKKSVKERIVNMTGASADSSGSQQNVLERFKMWNKTVLMIKDKPLFGAGPGNWSIDVPKYGTEGMVWAFGEYFPDRPHNVFLQLASETGIPGALIYFTAWLFIVIIGFQTLMRTRSEDQKILVILMLSGLAAFAVDCVFSFPTERIEHSVYFIFMAGIILGTRLSLPTGNTESSQASRGKPLDKPLLFVFLFTAAFNIFLGFKKLNFEKAFAKARAYYQAGHFQQAIDEGNKGKSSWSTIDPLGESIELMNSLAWKDMKDYNKALEEVRLAKKYNPNSVMVYNNLGTIFTDMQQYDSAISNYKKALELAPHFQIPMKNLAVNYFVTSRFAECVKIFEKIDIGGDPYLTSMLKDAKDSLKLK